MFQRLKNIFNRIFFKRKLLQEKNLSESNTIKNEVIINDFKKQFGKDSEIYDIQRMYDSDMITEDDLTIKQIKQLINIYKEQIASLNKENIKNL